jgi:LmbE family N-acetylglucosaminyl deacetylase
VLLIAPHPDDEVLGAGGALTQLAAIGRRVTIVAVTDGEASHPGQKAQLRSVRPDESDQALRRLGLSHVPVRRLRLPDGGIRPEALAQALAPWIEASDVVLAPWRRDGHPDHDVTGAVAAILAAEHNRPLLAYLVWAWHWASPAGTDIPWSSALRVALPPLVLAAKAQAVQAFSSQLTGASPILPPHVLERLLRRYEILLAEAR